MSANNLREAHKEGEREGPKDHPISSTNTQASTWPPPAWVYERGARKQVKEPPSSFHKNDAGNYNIWYGKYETTDGGRMKGKATCNPDNKCCVATDAGVTRGDANSDSYVCFLFAKGTCHNGKECNYLHRVADDEIEAKTDLSRDVFGRERHGTDRDDMGGTGSFGRANKTLYIGGIKTLRDASGAETRVREGFGEFGELTSCKVFPQRSIGFVTYKNRTAAEFAKIAMAEQSLGQSDVLNVRWAMADPNPHVQRENQARVNEQAIDAIQKAGFDTSDSNFNYPAGYAAPAGEKGVYPDTAAQFEAHAAKAEQTQQATAWVAYYVQQATAAAAATAAAEASLAEAAAAAPAADADDGAAGGGSSADWLAAAAHEMQFKLEATAKAESYAKFQVWQCKEEEKKAAAWREYWQKQLDELDAPGTTDEAAAGAIVAATADDGTYAAGSATAALSAALSAPPAKRARSDEPPATAAAQAADGGYGRWGGGDGSAEWSTGFRQQGGGGGGGGGGGICFDFQRGACTRGDSCKYEHVQGASSGVCFDFQKGLCTRGDGCKFEHVVHQGTQ